MLVPREQPRRLRFQWRIRSTHRRAGVLSVEAGRGFCRLDISTRMGGMNRSPVERLRHAPRQRDEA
jgi:hypothetical protein